MPVPATTVTTERLEDITVVHVSATVDGLAALEFERTALAELDAGLRLFVVDLEKVSIITSAGLRVLLILRKRLHAEGGLVLCGVTAKIKTLLDISGLSRHFAAVGSRDDAIAYLRDLQARRAKDSAALAGPEPSALSRLVTQLLGCGAASGRPTGSSAPAGLAARIAELLRKPGPDGP
jgi:anti-anti-sigma factor